MEQKHILIELSHKANDGTTILYDLIIAASYQANIDKIGGTCKDINAISGDADKCKMIAGWVKLFGIFIISNDIEQNESDAREIYLADGSSLFIDGWDIIDESNKQFILRSNEYDPTWVYDENDTEKHIYEFCDRLTLYRTDTNISNQVYVASRLSYGKLYDIVLKPSLALNCEYSLYQGTIFNTHVNIIANRDQFPMIVDQGFVDGAHFIACNALELFTGSNDPYDCCPDNLELMPQQDLSNVNESEIIVMDYIELQAINTGSAFFAFYGNDPAI
ncbi:TPA: hypothetical protein MW242_002645 [Acinetobacter baumannii]|nr:hypothetical protein [Acinetobacter baumannii]